MSQESVVAQEQSKLLEERAQIEAELNHLRELMQAEVDVEPDEGDSEVFEREKNAVLIGVLERRLSDIDTGSNPWKRASMAFASAAASRSNLSGWK